MSKSSKNYRWLNTRPNSAKTLIERAKREVPDFAEHIQGYSEVTIASDSMYGLKTLNFIAN